MGYNRTLGHFTNSQELATVWASGQNYIVNQLVLNNNKLYRCITAHTSGATFAGDSANWAGLNPGATVAISEGGTGQTTKTDAFDALAPTTTAGDLIVYNGTDNVRLPVGTDGQMIVADASQTNKLKWATVPQGSKNYVTYSNFENNATTGWSLFNTTLDANKIPNGAISPGPSVTNPLSALSINSISPLAGSYSLSVTSAGSINAAQGFITDVLTIDREDQAKVLTFSFYYEALTTNMNFSGTSSNTWAIYIHDGTNWIQPAGVYGMTQSSGAGLVTGTFQTNATGTSYRVAVICINGTSGAVSMRFDDFKLGPQTAPIGPVVTDWVSYTPTGGWTSNTTYSGRYRRVGDTMEVQFLVSLSGAPNVAGLSVNLPSGFTADTSKIAASSLPDVLGSAQALKSGNGYLFGMYLASATSIQVSYISNGAISIESNVTNTAPVTWASGDTINGSFRVPIIGWASQVQLSNDTDTRVVAFSAYDGGGVTTTNTTTLLPMGTTEIDTHAVRSGNTYVIPVSGFYRISAKSTSKFSAGNIANNHALIFYKNGVAQNNGDYGNADAANGSGLEFFFLSINSIVRLNAGDIIDFRYFTNYLGAATTYLKYCSIERLSGPSVVAASETVACLARKNTGSQTTSGSVQTVAGWLTPDINTHGTSAFNPTTGIFTAPISGTYHFNGNITFGVNGTGSRSCYLSKNSPTNVYAFGNFLRADNLIRMSLQVNSLIYLNAGETCMLVAYQDSGGSVGYSTLTEDNHISIVRVGN